MTTDKQARKERPVARGVLDYFPDAIAAVAHVSHVGNQQHNPGQPLHWARGTSDDHADCIARHLIERGTVDNDGVRHSAKLAWRALANLQIELEKDAKPLPFENDPRRFEVYCQLQSFGCPATTAKTVAGGVTFAGPEHQPASYVYIAGPMRGIEKFNFPAFDAARDRFLKLGYNVISPADIDRVANPNADDTTQDVSDQTVFAFRDFFANFFLKKMDKGHSGIVLLDGWPRSTGATGELFLDKWLGLKAYRPDGTEYPMDDARHDFALFHAVAPVPANPAVPVEPPSLDGDYDVADGVQDIALPRGKGHFFRICGTQVFQVPYSSGIQPPAGFANLPYARRQIAQGRWTPLTHAEKAKFAGLV